MVQTERFQQIQNAKDSHKKVLDNHRSENEAYEEGQRRKCGEDKEVQRQRLLAAYNEELNKKRNQKLEVEVILKDTKSIALSNNSRDLLDKKELISNIRSNIN